MNHRDTIVHLLLDTLKRMEGLRLKSYKPKGEKDTGNKYTIGYGHFGVPAGLVITEEIAEYILIVDIQKKYGILSERMDFATGSELKLSTLSLSRQMALVSFVFNLGVGAFFGSTMWRLIKDDVNNPAISKEFAKWVYSGKNKLQGLVTRRAYEARLWDLDSNDYELLLKDL